MKYSYVLPVAALASQALAAPALVTQTNVVYVTADATTVFPSSSSVVAPQVGAALEVVISELVEIKGGATNTYVSTFTRTHQHHAHTRGADSSSVEESSSVAPVSTTEAASTTIASTSAAAAPTSASVQVKAQSLDATSQSAEPTTTSVVQQSSTVVPTTSSTSSTNPRTTLAPTTSTQPSSTTSTSSTASATTSSSDSLSSFASAILNEHNVKRALNDADPLTWSSTLADYAQAYADKYDCSGTLTHSGGQYGENLALGYSSTGAVDAWYDEISDYDPSNPVYSHFTQVVWKSTTKLGCGYKTCDNIWGQYTICSYDPAGNVEGEYAANVSV